MRDAELWRSLAAASRSPRATALLFCWFALMFVGTAQHGQVSADVVATYLPAWSLGQLQTADLDAFHRGTMFLREVDGHWRSDRFPGAILPAVPAYALLGGGTPSIGPSLLTAALMSALTVALIHRTLLRITGAGTALAATLVFGLGTPVWTVSADALWTHTSTQLGLAAVLYGLAAGRPWISGLGMVLSAAARPHTAIAAAVLGIGAFLRDRRLAPGLWLAAGALGGFAVVLWWTAATLGEATLFPGSYAGRGGDVLTAGNAAGEEAAAFGWPVNLAGFLVSPERGVLVLCPFVVPCVVGMRRAWRTAPSFAKDAAIAAVLYTFAQLAVNGFGGGWGFFSFRHGLEGLTLATPMLVLGGVAAARTWLGSRAIVLLVGYAVGVHTLGAVFYVAYDEGPVWWTKYQPYELATQGAWTLVPSIAVGVLVAGFCAVMVRADTLGRAGGFGDSRGRGVGRNPGMGPDDDAVQTRAHLLPEEERTGSADPTAQAEAILTESEERVQEPTADDPRTPGDDGFEHRRSDEIV